MTLALHVLASTVLATLATTVAPSADVLFVDVLAAVGSAVLAVVGWLAALLIHRHVRAKRVAEALLRLKFATTSAVKTVWQTYVQELKESVADGKLSDEEKAEARRRALRVAKSFIGMPGLKLLAYVFGFEGANDAGLSELIEDHIESSLRDVKLEGRAAEAGSGVARPFP